MIYIIVENRFHRLSQVLDTLGSLGENAILTVFIASEFVILGVGEVLGYDLSISIHAEIRDLGILTKREQIARNSHIVLHATMATIPLARSMVLLSTTLTGKKQYILPFTS